MAVRITILIALAAYGTLSDGKPRDMPQDKAIINGEDANIEDIPYAAGILYCRRFFCGGTIIGEKFVLTAAHCIYKRNITGFLQVRIGSSYRDKDGVVHQVKRAVPHPKFQMIELDYDAAVLELEEPIKFNKYAKAIQITDEEPKDGEMARVSGWGRNGTWTVPNQLQTILVPIQDRETCRSKIDAPVSERFICTSEGEKCPFWGDSGGPIVVNDKVVGAVSFGNGGRPGSTPSGYANFANNEIRKFIKEESGI